MERHITFIGFGEAGMTFAGGMPVRPRAYDRKAATEATRRAKLADYERLGVDGKLDNAAATAGSTLVLSLVTADCSLAAARETVPSIAPGALFLDMNSVAPATKAETATIVDQAGGRYVDAAIMAPVHPKARAVPILLSGAAAGDAAEALSRIGFTHVRVVGERVGQASAIKMIRSVMVKGLEALTTEMILAADAAGVTDEVIASLNASWPGTDWAAKADYNLDRMMVHGLRRAAEMEEVAKTLDSLGTGAAMTRGTIERQRAIGALDLTPPDTLPAKIDAVLGRRKDQAA
jgi:3-hydroxyisobutyrate dehydrogenase-like beta-hydroxyacid dehydrogenase